jgi:hypothetical protein
MEWLDYQVVLVGRDPLDPQVSVDYLERQVYR